MDTRCRRNFNYLIGSVLMNVVGAERKLLVLRLLLNNLSGRKLNFRSRIKNNTKVALAYYELKEISSQI